MKTISLKGWRELRLENPAKFTGAPLVRRFHSPQILHERNENARLPPSSSDTDSR
jgi:hypothetical protein